MAIKPRSTVSVMVALAFAWASSARAEPVGFMPVGDLPGGAFESRATAVSADGTTVVGYSTSTQFNPAGGDVAFRLQTGAIQSLGALFTSPPTAAFSRAYGVSSNGAIVSGQSREVFSDAFVWNNGVMNSGGEENYPNNMSANGVYVGYTTYGPWIRPWTSANGPLPPIPGGDIFASNAGQAIGISDNGSVVVGQSSYSFNQSNPHQAFRWSSITSTVGLGFLPGHTQSSATAVSGNGQLIGGVSGSGIGSGTPFLWTQAGGIVSFPGLFTPKAMSFDGSVIVGGGWVWDPVYGRRSLHNILTGAGVDMTGWSIHEISDVSADGLVVVGWGANPQNQIEGFRAVIPEPATAGFMLIGMATLLSRRRR